MDIKYIYSSFYTLAVLFYSYTCSVTGNRTLVSRVTGGDTSHYTMTDLMTSLSHPYN